MNLSKQIDVHFLHECFTYEADTGNIYWKSRPSSHFKNESACQNWNNRHAGKKAGSVDAKGYRVIKLLGTPHKAHRIIWALTHGQYPEGFIDHINGMTDDNRLGNLRVVDFVTNAQNSKTAKNNTSGSQGVWLDKETGKWRASIVHLGQRVSLGSHLTREDANDARKKAERDYCYHPNHGRT